MDTEIRTPFLERLLLAHPELNQLPIEPPVFDEWQGARLIVPSPPGSDVFGGLFIEDLSGELTIGLDHTHCHMAWPPSGSGSDPMEFIDAIFNERIVAATGWRDGEFSVGWLCAPEEVGELGTSSDIPGWRAPVIQTMRVRSWFGRLDRDIPWGSIAAGLGH